MIQYCSQAVTLAKLSVHIRYAFDDWCCSDKETSNKEWPSPKLDSSAAAAAEAQQIGNMPPHSADEIERELLQ